MVEKAAFHIHSLDIHWHRNWEAIWIPKSYRSNTETEWLHGSGQIIATSHDLTPNGGLVREIPLFQGNLGWWNIIICPDGYPKSFESKSFESPFGLPDSYPKVFGCLGMRNLTWNPQHISQGEPSRLPFLHFFEFVSESMYPVFWISYMANYSDHIPPNGGFMVV